MDINPSMTNIAPVDSKPQGVSALQEGQKAKIDGVATKVEAAKQKEAVEEKATVAEKPVDAKELNAAVEKINNQLKIDQKGLAFSVDEASGRDVVSILDTKSKEVIKQYPTEEVLKLAADLGELTEGGSMEQAFNIFTSEA